MTHISVDRVLSKAKLYVKDGKIDEARLSCQKILESFPQNIRVKQFLGTLVNKNRIPKKVMDQLVLLYNDRNFITVIEKLENLLNLYPEDCYAWNLKGVGYLSLGRDDDALKAFEMAITYNKKNPEYYNNLGVTLEKLLNLSGAVNAFKKALALRPNYIEPIFNLGNTFKSQGNLESAIEFFNKAIILKPDDDKSYNNLGSVFLQQGKTDRAIEILEKAIEINDKNALIYNNLGNAFQRKLFINRSIELYGKAISINPNFFQAYNNLGNSFKLKGNLSASLDMFYKSLSINPNYADAYNNLGTTLKELGKLEEAIKVFKKAIDLKPNFADALSNLAVIMKIQGNLDESIKLFDQALIYKPDFKIALIQRIHQLSQICDWNRVEKDFKSISDIGIHKQSLSPFSLLSLEDNPQNHKKRSENYALKSFMKESIPFNMSSFNSKKRIRIGYFSADFHDHATMHLMSKIFTLHDREKFEVYAYSIGPKRDDYMRQKLIQSVDVFDDVSQMSDRDIALLSRQDEIDIAIDLKGYTHQSRTGIFAFRAAPIQINYLGYPGTMGADFMDYIIADRIIIPEELRDCYTEEIIYMPNSYQPNNNERPISTREITKSNMGLPENSFVFCSFNNSYKITPKEFDIWMNILKRVEGSVLWLLKSNEWAEENLKKEAQDRGVNSSRIIFANKLPHKEHLRRLQLADLFIDTFHVNAHTTASDALWAGVPVVTKIGKGFAARVAASLLNAVGLPELITNNAKDYESLILDLASSPDKLTKIKKKLSINRLSNPLFDSEKYTKHLENGYEQTYQNYINKRIPQTINIKN